MRWTPQLESRLVQLVQTQKPYRIEDWIPIGAELGVSGHAARMKAREPRIKALIAEGKVKHTISDLTGDKSNDNSSYEGTTYVTPLQPEPLTEAPLHVKVFPLI